jgi:hypothetical protein
MPGHRHEENAPPRRVPPHGARGSGSHASTARVGVAVPLRPVDGGADDPAGVLRERDGGTGRDAVLLVRAQIRAAVELATALTKEFVPCGMAATVAVWSRAPPPLDRFRA